ncbi:MAG: hypothetical protein JWQ08_1292, partial [Deinococcus sp.]|nr:hypothetical protein [Deinococcus sp.]
MIPRLNLPALRFGEGAGNGEA